MARGPWIASPRPCLLSCAPGTSVISASSRVTAGKGPASCNEPSGAPGHAAAILAQAFYPSARHHGPRIIRALAPPLPSVGCMQWWRRVGGCCAGARWQVQGLVCVDGHVQPGQEYPRCGRAVPARGRGGLLEQPLCTAPPSITLPHISGVWPITFTCAQQMLVGNVYILESFLLASDTLMFLRRSFTIHDVDVRVGLCWRVHCAPSPTMTHLRVHLLFHNVRLWCPRPS